MSRHDKSLLPSSLSDGSGLGRGTIDYAMLMLTNPTEPNQLLSTLLTNLNVDISWCPHSVAIVT